MVSRQRPSESRPESEAAPGRWRLRVRGSWLRFGLGPGPGPAAARAIPGPPAGRTRAIQVTSQQLPASGPGRRRSCQCCPATLPKGPSAGESAVIPTLFWPVSRQRHDLGAPFHSFENSTLIAGTQARRAASGGGPTVAVGLYDHSLKW